MKKNDPNISIGNVDMTMNLQADMSVIELSMAMREQARANAALAEAMAKLALVFKPVQIYGLHVSHNGISSGVVK